MLSLAAFAIFIVLHTLIILIIVPQDQIKGENKTWYSILSLGANPNQTLTEMVASGVRNVVLGSKEFKDLSGMMGRCNTSGG